MARTSRNQRETHTGFRNSYAAERGWLRPTEAGKNGIKVRGLLRRRKKLRLKAKLVEIQSQYGEFISKDQPTQPGCD